LKKIGVKVSFNPITTSIQARLLDLFRMPGISGQVGVSIYALSAFVTTVSFDGVDYDPKAIADKADLADKDTIASLYTLAKIIDKTCFLADDEKKTPNT